MHFSRHRVSDRISACGVRRLVDEDYTVTNQPLKSLCAVVGEGANNLSIVELVIRAVAELVGNEGGVVSGVINLESSGVEASDWRPRHDEHYHEA